MPLPVSGGKRKNGGKEGISTVSDGGGGGGKRRKGSKTINPTDVGGKDEGRFQEGSEERRGEAGRGGEEKKKVAVSQK